MSPPKYPPIMRFFYFNGTESHSIEVRQPGSRATPSPRSRASAPKRAPKLKAQSIAPVSFSMQPFPQDPADLSDPSWAIMPLDDFLAAMGWEEPAPEEAVFETAASLQTPSVTDFSPQPVTSGWDTLYPGHAHVPCIGVRTDSDGAAKAKEKLLRKYNELGLELLCHTCGDDLRGGKFVAGYFLEKSWIGDHQPPTSAYRWPAKMQVLTSFAQFRNIWLVESKDGMYQTRCPFPDQLKPLFDGQTPHPYPRYPAFGVRPQRYVYPQCEACSRLQSHSL